MSLKDGIINPLNVHNLRRLSFCPPHFTCLKIDSHNVIEKMLTDWIYENFEGRFYVGSDINSKMVVGFERPGESTYFGLMLPSIIQN